MMDDPFPNAPSFDELEEMYQPVEDFDDIGEYSSANEDWYEAAPSVAARLMVTVARDHDDFREHLLEDDSFGSAHEMRKYDKEAHRKLNGLKLSALQGGTAESMARSKLRGDD